HYEELSADIDGAAQALAGLEQAVDAHFGREAPSLLAVRKALDDCRTLVGGITKRKRELEPGAQDSAETGGAEPAADGASWTAPKGDAGLGDRQEALRQLAAVAAFFRRTEPHSPVSYLVQRAVQWGRMPLDDWLREVIHDEGVLAHVRETLGLKAPGAGQP